MSTPTNPPEGTPRRPKSQTRRLPPPTKTVPMWGIIALHCATVIIASSAGFAAGMSSSRRTADDVSQLQGQVKDLQTKVDLLVSFAGRSIPQDKLTQLTQNVLDLPNFRVVRQFLEAKTVDERLEYVRNPDLVAPLMRKFYGNKVLGVDMEKTIFKTDDYTSEDIAKLRDTKPGEQFAWRVRVKHKGAKDWTEMWVVRDRDGKFKIDWESSMPYNPMSTSEIKLNPPSAPIELRVYIEIDPDLIDDAWDAAYKHGVTKENYFPVQFSTPGDYSHILGYVKKGSKEAEELYNEVRDGDGSSPALITINEIYQDDSDTFAIINEVNNGKAWLDW
ncbi:MAG TPA: hypothetical protein V6D47_14090 [Oscillatoriaceae cyanobacterium]